MTKGKALRAIARAYDALHTVEYYADLKPLKLTPAEYHTALAVMESLRAPGSSAKCFMQAVAEFFGRCGYDVKPGNVNYTISC